MNKIISLILVLSLMLGSGCAGVKKIPNKKLDGSVTKEKRTPPPITNYSNYKEVLVNKGTTNIIDVQIIDDGKILTTFPVKVITPPQNKYVQVTGEVKKEKQSFNWFLTIRYFGIVIGLFLALLYFVGWHKIKEFIVSPFSRRKNFD